jgi:alpha-mannosidase
VGRWADVSGAGQGITWVTLDAPLVQVGGITANLLNSQTNPDVWRKQVPPSQKLYSWAMNNHWGTNYRAYQEGAAWFRFVLRPHRRFDAAEATRFANGFGQPLLAVAARGAAPSREPWLKLEPSDVLMLSLKPSDDGQALITRLYGASGAARNARFQPTGFKAKTVNLSDTSERPGARVSGSVPVPGYGVVTLRTEW